MRTPLTEKERAVLDAALDAYADQCGIHANLPQTPPGLIAEWRSTEAAARRLGVILSAAEEIEAVGD